MSDRQRPKTPPMKQPPPNPNKPVPKRYKTPKRPRYNPDY